MIIACYFYEMTGNVSTLSPYVKCASFAARCLFAREHARPQRVANTPSRPPVTAGSPPFTFNDKQLT
jgi:hypothetical protein